MVNIAEYTVDENRQCGTDPKAMVSRSAERCLAPTPIELDTRHG